MYWTKTESDGFGAILSETVIEADSKPQDECEPYRAGGHDDAPIYRQNNTVYDGPFESYDAALVAISNYIY